MSKYIEMGSYYQANPYGLVRTICKAIDEAGDAQIVYVNVGKNGFVGDAYLMPENEFSNIFLNSHAVGVN